MRTLRILTGLVVAVVVSSVLLAAPTTPGQTPTSPPTATPAPIVPEVRVLKIDLAIAEVNNAKLVYDAAVAKATGIIREQVAAIEAEAGPLWQYDHATRKLVAKPPKK